jgi:hypothetical protein
MAESQSATDEVIEYGTRTSNIGTNLPRRPYVGVSGFWGGPAVLAAGCRAVLVRLGHAGPVQIRPESGIKLTCRRLQFSSSDYVPSPPTATPRCATI